MEIQISFLGKEDRLLGTVVVISDRYLPDVLHNYFHEDNNFGNIPSGTERIRMQFPKELLTAGM